MRFVPMLLTIGFLWLAARAGRRAVRAGPGRPALVDGRSRGGRRRGAPVAILSAVCSTLVTLFFPTLGLRVLVDASSAALWAGILAAAGAADRCVSGSGSRSAVGGRGPRRSDGVRLGARASGRRRVRGGDARAGRDPSIRRRSEPRPELSAGCSSGITCSRSRRRAPCCSRPLRVHAWRSSERVRCSISARGVSPHRGRWGRAPSRAAAALPMALAPERGALRRGDARRPAGGDRRSRAPPASGRLGVAAGLVFALFDRRRRVAGGASTVTTPVVSRTSIPCSHVTCAPRMGADVDHRAGLGGRRWGTRRVARDRRYAEPELPRPTSA